MCVSQLWDPGNMTGPSNWGGGGGYTYLKRARFSRQDKKN